MRPIRRLPDGAATSIWTALELDPPLDDAVRYVDADHLQVEMVPRQRLRAPKGFRRLVAAVRARKAPLHVTEEASDIVLGLESPNGSDPRRRRLNFPFHEVRRVLGDRGRMQRPKLALDSG